MGTDLLLWPAIIVSPCHMWGSSQRARMGLVAQQLWTASLPAERMVGAPFQNDRVMHMLTVVAFLDAQTGLDEECSQCGR
jgi:hypothetical protein